MEYLGDGLMITPLMKAYKTEARSWYDLARSAIAAVEKYNHLSRKTN